MKEKTIREVAQSGGKARWAKIAKKERAQIMSRVAKKEKFAKKHNE